MLEERAICLENDENNPSHPMHLFERWYRVAAGKQPPLGSFWRQWLFLCVSQFRHLVRWIYPPMALHQPNAIALATASASGRPSLRMLLFKGYAEGGFQFYTNFGSRKAADMKENPRAAMVFHWSLPERQVRIEGRVERLDKRTSESYWKSRPRGSQIGAVASKQSTVLRERNHFFERIKKFEHIYKGQEVPLPEFWGGYRLVADRIEFWEGKVDRLHIRHLFIHQNGQWQRQQLYP